MRYLFTCQLMLILSEMTIYIYVRHSYVFMQSNKYIIITTAIIILMVYGAGCIDATGTYPETTTYTSDVSPPEPPSNQNTFDDSINTNTETNSIGMDFILIPAGEFDMGSKPSEKYMEYSEYLNTK